MYPMIGMWRAAAAAVVMLVFACGVSAQQMPKFPADSYMAKIQQRGKFNAGVKAELRGVGFQNPMTGKFEGFGVDLAADLAERIFGKPGQITYKPALPKT